MVINPIAKNTIGYKRWAETFPSSEANSPMSTTDSQTSAELAIALLTHYSFDLSGYTASELVYRWQSQFPGNWMHLAVVEALYQGRYKGISVQQILAFWQRRGQVIYHFNMEFERLICSKFPESLTALAAPVLPPIKQEVRTDSVTQPQLSPVTANPLPVQVGNGYEPSQAATLQLINAEADLLNHEVEAKLLERQSILAASTLHATSSGTKTKQNSQRHLPRNSPLPKPQQQTNLLPSSVNHPPIGQFTPDTSDRSESFTSKLKAMSDDQA